MSTARLSKVLETKPTDNPLINHLNIFAGQDGYIDEQSIFESLTKKWHLSEEKARNLAVNTMRVAALMGIPGATIGKYLCGKPRFLAKDAIKVFTHPYDTGFYGKTDGSFDKEAFNKFLRAYAVHDDDGNILVTRTRLNRYLEARRGDVPYVPSPEVIRWGQETKGCFGKLFQKIGEKGNQGEFDIYFDKCSSHWVKKEPGKWEPAVTAEAMEQFYRNSAPILEDVANGTLPAPAPRR